MIGLLRRACACERPRLVAAGLAAAILFGAGLLAWGWAPVWPAILLLIAAVCPVLALGIYGMSERPLPIPIEAGPPTRGATLNWLAPWYDRVAAALGFGARFHQQLLGLMALKPGGHVLDVGCATGSIAILAAEAVGPSGEVWGIDPAPDMIRIALQRSACRRRRPRFRAAIGEQLPFPDASFDVAVASLVLHHLPPDLKLKALGEIRRTLRPGGRLLVAELHRPRGLPARLLSAPLRGLSWLRPHLSGGTPRLLEAAGFRSVRELARWGGGVAVWEALKS